MFNKLGASEADLLQLGNDRTKQELIILIKRKINVQGYFTTRFL